MQMKDNAWDLFDKWAENANWGDDYVYDGNHYTLEHP